METSITQAALATQGAASGSEPVLNAGYGATLTSDVGAFGQSLERAARQASEPSHVARAMLAPLDRLNAEASSLADYAQSAIKSGNDMTPSEIVMLTVRSQEFMFHSTLTSNVANRTSDGLQQLFRQQ